MGSSTQQYEVIIAAAAAKSLQSCPTLWPHRRQPTRPPVPGILQARTLERVAMFFSNAWNWKVKVKSLSCVRLLATPWTAAHQAHPSAGFSRQECWSGVPLPSPEVTIINPILQGWLCVPKGDMTCLRLSGSKGVDRNSNPDLDLTHS